MSWYALAAFFICLAMVDSADNQTCSQYTIMKDFELTKLEGKWFVYGHQNIFWDKIKPAGECGYVKYSENGTSKCKVFDYVQKIGDKDDEYNGGLCYFTDDKQARMLVGMRSGNDFAILRFWMLKTDYKEYAIAMRCDERESSPFVMVQTKDAIPTNETKDKINKALEANHIDPKNVSVIDHGDICSKK